MADIRKRTGRNGVSYQVRYPNSVAKSGYAYASFDTRKEAQAFVESGKTLNAPVAHHAGVQTVLQATDLWLDICEKEGLNGREPVTAYTFENYRYRAGFIKRYGDWKAIHQLTAPDIVAFRSSLLQDGTSRYLAGRILSTFQSIMREMVVRGILKHNVAAGICIRADARFQTPVVIPSKKDVIALLEAADRLAKSKHPQVARTWSRYRPILYLAADSGMRPQEYLALSTSALGPHGVHVERAIDGSGKSISVTKTPAGRRYIELSPTTLDMVRHYAENLAVENDHDLVFPAFNGALQSRHNWQRRGFDVACMEAGLIETVERDGREIERPKFRPYDLRHFFASMLIEKKVNLKKIQTLMGHKNIETTLNVYGHLLDEQEIPEEGKHGMICTMLLETCGGSVADGGKSR